MKHFLLAFALLPFATHAQQPEPVTQAIIYSTMTVIAPETEEDASRMPNAGDGNIRFSMRNFGDGESKITTYIKDSLVKTIFKSDMGRTTIIRNNSAHTTTTLLEMMGNNFGFIVTDEEQIKMREQMDSMIQARRDADSSTRALFTSNETSRPAEIIYTDEARKISGMDCKKALLINTGLLGIKDTVAVWYAPDINIPNNQPASGGGALRGRGGIGNFTTLNGLNQLKGLAIKYEMNMRHGRVMQMEVTKVDLKKTLSDKDFRVPKDFDVKPYSEFSKMFRGMPQMRMMPRQ